MKCIKYNLLISLLVICFSGICQDRHNDTDCKKIPLIDYIPYNYTADLQNAMKGDVGVGYVEYCTDSIYAYFRHITHLPHRGKSPIKYSREIKALDLKMSTGSIFDNFNEMVKTSDSIFFFSFFPNRLSIFDYDILGRHKNGKVIFVDKDKKEFDNIRDLINDRFGSMDSFIRAYFDFQKRALLCDYKNNGLYDFYNAEDAIVQLKNDYNFHLYYNPDDINGAIELLINQLGKIVPVGDKKDELFCRIRHRIDSANPVEFSEILLRSRQYCGRIYFAGYPIDSDIRECFNVNDYEAIVTGLMVHWAETLSAYEYLGDSYKKDILTTGSGIMDDVSILNYIKKIVYANACQN